MRDVPRGSRTNSLSDFSISGWNLPDAFAGSEEVLLDEASEPNLVHRDIGPESHKTAASWHANGRRVSPAHLPLH